MLTRFGNAAAKDEQRKLINGIVRQRAEVASVEASHIQVFVIVGKLGTADRSVTITYAACGGEGTGARGCRYSTFKTGPLHAQHTVFLFFWKLVAQALLAGCGRQRCRASTLPIREAGGSPVALDCRSVARAQKGMNVLSESFSDVQHP